MAPSPASPSEVYILDFDANRYAGLLVADERDLDRLDAFVGAPIGAEWVPLRMAWETRGGALPKSDFCGIAGGGFVFNARAVDALGDLLAGRGELLAIEVLDEQQEHYVFNVTRLSDALDEQRSQLAYFSDGGLMDIDRYEFDRGRLADETIFKLRQIPEVYEYVTGEFRRRVEQAGLSGFTFDRRVWSAQDGEGRAS